MNTPREITLIDASEASITSANAKVISVARAKRINLIFTASGISSGNGAFEIEGSFDGTTYEEIQNLVKNVASASTADLTESAAPTLSGNGSETYSLEHSGFKYLRAYVTVTTDGAYTCKAFIQD